jgi:hypothetical protein
MCAEEALHLVTSLRVSLVVGRSRLRLRFDLRCLIRHLGLMVGRVALLWVNSKVKARQFSHDVNIIRSLNV